MILKSNVFVDIKKIILFGLKKIIMASDGEQALKTHQ